MSKESSNCAKSRQAWHDLIEGQRKHPNPAAFRAGWKQLMEVAQTEQYLSDAHQVAFERLAHGGKALCPDCECAPNQLHVPGCEFEACPRCGGQLITCSCFDLA